MRLFLIFFAVCRAPSFAADPPRLGEKVSAAEDPVVAATRHLADDWTILRADRLKSIQICRTGGAECKSLRIKMKADVVQLRADQAALSKMAKETGAFHAEHHVEIQ